jgi:hypothetical protein
MHPFILFAQYCYVNKMKEIRLDSKCDFDDEHAKTSAKAIIS